MTEDIESIPRRSPDGLAALDLFFDEFNDIHFYIEDEDQENLYEILLKRLFPLLTIARIFPLGGKEAVIRHALTPSFNPAAPFRAYIVDKDLDDLLGSTTIHPNLFYLDRYCIENYLIDEGALVELVVENHPKAKRAVISASLALANQIDRIATDLRPLFTLFFFVQYFNLGLKNCGAPPERYCVPTRRWEVDGAALESYKVEVNLIARGVGITPGIDDPLTDARVTPAINANTHSLISGKYMCAMLHHYIKSKYTLGSMTFDSFVFRLAKNGTSAPLRGVAERISTAASTAKPNITDRVQVAP